MTLAFFGGRSPGPPQICIAIKRSPKCNTHRSADTREAHILSLCKSRRRHTARKSCVSVLYIFPLIRGYAENHRKKKKNTEPKKQFILPL